MPTIIITGANGNLGQVVTSYLLSLHYRVIAVTGPGGAGSLPPHSHLIIDEVDLANEQKTTSYIRSVTSQFPDIQAGVLLVGGFAMGRLAETSDQMLEDMIRLNFHTAFHIVRPLFSFFESKPDGGQFILIGSRPGLYPSEGTAFFAYSFSKSMVIRLAEFINAEGAGKHITASVIAPSTIDTPATRAAMPEADFSKWIPPSAIAEAIAFSLTGAGRTMHGHVMKMFNR